MNQQPEALRLADDLDAYHTRSIHKESAIELRRLHAENEALRNILKLCRPYMYEHASNTIDGAFDKLCGALDAAMKGQS